MVDMPAPALRIGFFLFDNSPEMLNENGWMLFDAAVDYAQNPFTAIDVNSQKSVSKDFVLYQNYPNPFNPVTRID